jgi:hypothetical protein
MGVAKEMSQQLIGCFRSVIPMLTTLVVLLLLLAPEGLHATDAGGVPEAMKGEEKKAAVETVGGEGSSDPVAVAAPAVRPPRKEDPDKTKPGTVVQMAHHWYSVVEKLGQGAAGSVCSITPLKYTFSPILSPGALFLVDFPRNLNNK